MNNRSNKQARVLVVDDDTDLLHLINLRLKANDYEVRALDNAKSALSLLASFQPHVVVTDLKMPGMDGMALFEEIQQRNIRTPVIVLTANGTIPDAVQATQKGVFSYLVKPFDAEILLHNLERAVNQTHLPGHADRVQTEDWRQEIISCSSAMENLLQQTHAAAVSDANILIQSETGTGKELLAKAVHQASNRASKPFLALNCAAIPESLIESELFGHAAGSFTGAKSSHPGIFQAADGGTVFLDEIGDMPMSAQAKLLRVLEQKEVRPVGATRTVPVNVRIVAATHQDLPEKVKNQEFREDLYYRLDVISLHLPALRDRREDIPLLVDYFCQQISERDNRQDICFAPEAMEALITATWPGNVRQLYNVVEQCVVLTTTPIIPRALVERALRYKPERLLSLSESRQQFERDYLVRLLNLTAGNIALASRLADRNRSEFYNLLKRHGLEPAEFRSSSADSD
ncbi:MAG: sigma 54-interacting transcriptional regulator [Gammaproteobacteria bacterium]|nr:sigma 54-interacting transcriptional regulator [Pseudomonadales bacterium]MCP5347413.1 sigma 54-interacting transcriptional regulator [Pseudomonadales bacterium]